MDTGRLRGAAAAGVAEVEADAPRRRAPFGRAGPCCNACPPRCVRWAYHVDHDDTDHTNNMVANLKATRGERASGVEPGRSGADGLGAFAPALPRGGLSLALAAFAFSFSTGASTNRRTGRRSRPRERLDLESGARRGEAR